MVLKVIDSKWHSAQKMPRWRYLRRQTSAMTHDVTEEFDQQWQELRAEAAAVAQRAYAPYSNYQVGAAALTADGRILVGCNVENAGLGVTLCAECGVISQLHATGGGRLVRFVCVNGENEVIMPCGRCRQILFEHGGNDLAMWTVRGLRTMAEVLPDAFGPDALGK